MNERKASIVKIDEYKPDVLRFGLERMFNDFGGLSKVLGRARRIIVKPNLIAKRFASQTNPILTVEIAKMIKQEGLDVVIADSPAWASVEYNARHSGLLELANRYDIPVLQLDRPKTVDNAGGKYFRKLTISQDALEADAIINVAKLKTHQQVKLTGAVKNMFGCVSGKLKALWHFRATNSRDESKFPIMIVETCAFMSPVFTIIDAIDAMEGYGPISGNLRHIGAIIGSRNPIACDVVGAKLVDCDVDSLPILTAAKQLGFGPIDFDELELIGDDIDSICVSDFRFPELMPIRFSLFRVVKSIAKQMMLMIHN